MLEYFDTVELKQHTPDTITDRKKLLELVRKAAREGLSQNFGENEPYICAICCPIYNHSGDMVAGVSISGLKEVISGREHDRLKDMLLDAAESISGELGYHGEMPGRGSRVKTKKHAG